MTHKRTHFQPFWIADEKVIVVLPQVPNWLRSLGVSSSTTTLCWPGGAASALAVGLCLTSVRWLLVWLHSLFVWFCAPVACLVVLWCCWYLPGGARVVLLLLLFLLVCVWILVVAKLWVRLCGWFCQSESGFLSGVWLDLGLLESTG